MTICKQCGESNGLHRPSCTQDNADALGSIGGGSILDVDGIRGRVMIGGCMEIVPGDEVQAKCGPAFEDIMMVGICIPFGFTLESLEVDGIDHSFALVASCPGPGGFARYETNLISIECGHDAIVTCRNVYPLPLTFSWLINVE